MTDRPILFSAPMVRALLAGRKTQTRQVLKPQPKTPFKNGVWYRPFQDRRQFHFMGRDYLIHAYHDVPYAPGDRLWVQEEWSETTAVRFHKRRQGITYWADLPDREPPKEVPIPVKSLLWHTAPRPKRSPSDMPRWASRLTLTVCEVRVQRLQEISEEDAIAEGVRPIWETAPCPAIATACEPWLGKLSDEGPNRFTVSIDGGSLNAPTAREAYGLLWNVIHGPDAWDANPWVVALTFGVRRGNIDEDAA